MTTSSLPDKHPSDPRSGDGITTMVSDDPDHGASKTTEVVQSQASRGSSNNGDFRFEQAQTFQDNHHVARGSQATVLTNEETSSGPLLYSGWWWAEGEALPFKVKACIAAPKAPVVPRHTSFGRRVARTTPPAVTPPSAEEEQWTLEVAREVQAWMDHPLVWREVNNTVQAVFLGRYRATFSHATPQGVWEEVDGMEGWVPTDDEAALRDVVEFLQGLSGSSMMLSSMVAKISEQMARHRQRISGVKRLTLWRSEGALQWSEFPYSPQFSKNVSSRLTSTVNSRVVDNFLKLWRSLLRRVAAFHPIWRPLLKACVGFPTLMVQAWKQVWAEPDAWSQRLIEQGGNVLAFRLALKQGLRPNRHLWQEALWVPQRFSRPATWRYVLRGPQCNIKALSTLKALMRRNEKTPEALIAQRLLVASLLPEAQSPVPLLAWDAVPMTVWDTVEHALTHDGASDHWFISALRSYLRAVQQSPWVEQRISMTVWLGSAKDVWEWASLLPRCPHEDPSWTWATLTDAAAADVEQHTPEWRSPVKDGYALGGRITPIVNSLQWRSMGQIMQNCLKDSRSDPYRRAALRGNAFLYRIDQGGHRSLVIFGYEPFSGRYYDWTVLEHRAMANSFPTDAHRDIAEALRVFHLKHVQPSTSLSSLGRLNQRVRRWARGGRSLRPLHAAKDATDPALKALFDAAWNQRRVARRFGPVSTLWESWCAHTALWYDHGNMIQRWKIALKPLVGTCLITGVFSFTMRFLVAWIGG